jgi:hypothetical protein
MAARPVHQLFPPAAAGTDEPTESSTRIKRGPAHSEDAEAAIQASLAAALDELDFLETASPSESLPRAQRPSQAGFRGFPKGMPPLPVAKPFPQNMPPLPVMQQAVALPRVAVLAAAPISAVAPTRRSTKPVAVALLLVLGVSAGALWFATTRLHLSWSQIGDAAAHMVRPSE